MFDNTLQESQTQRAITEMTLYGKRPFSDEIDHRPLPDADELTDAVYNAFDVLNTMFKDTRLEEDAQGILWGYVNLFHRKAEQVQRALDKNEDAQKRSQNEQGGSEVKSVELEDLITEGQTMLEQQQVFEFLRDQGAEYFEVRTGETWRPAAGSMVNRQAVTSAIVDSRHYIKAKQQQETQVHVPEGALIAFAGGKDYNDHNAIWTALDKVKARLDKQGEKMVLAHCGNKKDADLIADRWGANKGVPRVPFLPDWKKHGASRAGFVRNDTLLAQLPKLVVIFPGNGITENLADKARAKGLHVYRPSQKNS